ncbi:DUF5722 domain-containing protein [Luteolibacter sp. LG18]|uniref:DUF5722 domain-containing protein n=1 Tax=Luteolibacter sp. LG18 TaxID=2819286 RepID=UPI002B2ACA9C|nr:hypothetical protein llg_18760 [Luteolibacter sp. LG18]
MQVFPGVLVIAAALCLTARAADVPCAIDPASAHHLAITKADDGSWELRTQGHDPYVFLSALPPGATAEGRTVLELGYFSTTGTDHFQVFVNPPCREDTSVRGAGIVPAQGWSTQSLDLAPALKKAGAPPKNLRLDFGTQPDKVIRLRSLTLRPMNAAEIARRDQDEEKARLRQQLTDRLKQYLAASYASVIDHVTIVDQQVVIEGYVAPGIAKVAIAELPMEREAYLDPPPAPGLELQLDERRRFHLELPRMAGGLDRMFSKWRLVGDGAPVSTARHADSVVAGDAPPVEMPVGRKGIGGFHHGGPVEDIAALGVGSATVNLPLGTLLRLTPGPGRTEFQHGGKTWYVDDRTVAGFDATLKAAADRHLIVSGILLLPQVRGFADPEVGRRMVHPEADPAGIYTMPNVTTAEGVATYAAAVDFLATRYSRPDKRFGRIHHWILHNEVNSGWIWTNAGDQTVERYTDLYVRSMRIVHLIASQHDPASKVFVSLEHDWNKPYGLHCYPGKTMLELIAALCRAEGDFEWALAFHPYPSDLMEPKAWNDKDATASFDTPKITYKNLEVLDAWMRRPEMLFQGQPRDIHLTEQGVNSRDYSEVSLREQAAGMAYAWNKLKPLSTIKVFDYHNWIDNRAEGGLRIGLRKFPDEQGDPLGKKPVWEVYRALDTPDEAATTGFAKPLIGIREWSEVKMAAPTR